MAQTAPHKNFDIAPADAKPSCTFTLAGREWACRQSEEVPLAVFKKMLSVSNAATADADAGLTPEEIAKKAETMTPEEAAKKAEATRESFTRIDDFFAATLAVDQVDDFMALLNDPQVTGITVGNLQPLMQYVTEHVLRRPTKRPASSRSRSRSTSPKSAVA